MEKSISNAFTYMFKGSDWKHKLLVLTLMSVPTGVMIYINESFKNLGTDNVLLRAILRIILVIVLLLISFIIEGYCCSCTQKIMNITEETAGDDLLPKWKNNFRGFLKIGFMLNVALFLLMIIPLFVILFAVKNIVLAGLLAIPFAIAIPIFCFFYVAMRTVFCVDFKISSFYSLKKARKLISANVPYYWGVIGIMLVLYIIYGILLNIFRSSILIIVVGPILQVYIYLVFAYLRGSLFTAPPEVLFNPEL